MDPVPWGYFTQSARSGQVRRDNAHQSLARPLATLPPGLTLQDQVEDVALRIARAR